MAIQSFFQELKRRNVYKVGTVYAITGWLIIQICDTVFPRLDLPEWTVTFVIVLVGIGFPVSLIFAWAFELTPEGLKRTSTVTESKTITRRTGKKLNYWIIGLLTTALLFLGVERIFFAESTLLEGNNNPGSNVSVAVLPFDDMSMKGDQEYFAHGISEELLNSLAQVRGLQVSGRTSSFQFKGENPDLKEVGQKLGVDHILEGSVRKAGDQLRITAQLIKAEDGFHVWSNTYDRDYTIDNILDIQTDISQQVLRELKVRLLPGEEEQITSRPTQNVEAYNLYLKGLKLSETWNPSDVNKAIDYFDRAIQLDSTFALAYAKKAMALILSHEFGNLPYDEMFKRSRKALDEAILLNPDLAEIYIPLGLIHGYRENYKLFLSAIEKAKDLMPNDAITRVYYHYALNSNGHSNKAEEELFYAYKLDPLSPLVNLEIGQEYIHKDSLAKAEEHFKKAIELRPDYLEAYRKLANLYGSRQGKHDEAIITMHQAYQTVADKTTTINLILYPAIDLELHGFARQYLEELKREFPNNLRTLRAEGYYLMNRERYNKLLDLLTNYDTEINPILDGFFVERFADPAILTGRHKEFLELVERRYPKALRTDTVNFGNRNLDIVLAAAVALQRSGNRGKADTLARNVCRYIENLPNDMYKSWNSPYIDEYAACNGLLDNKEPVIHFFRERLRVSNVISHWAVFGFENELYYGLSEEELKPFREKEREILERQRENVIAYLKEQGEWKDEWVERKL